MKVSGRKTATKTNTSERAAGALSSGEEIVAWVYLYRGDATS
jgi:hypothetical protein